MTNPDTMRDSRIINIGADHAGFEHKEAIKEWLESEGYDVVDHGAYEFEAEDDYPDFIAPVASAVSGAPSEFGIVIGGSGQGEAIVANRFPGVRAIVYNGQYIPADGREVPEEIITARQHNDANIISLGARFLSIRESIEAIELFIDTEFSGEERHIRRIEKIDDGYHS